ncbi:hypothetical protein MPNT_370006 [Candidatus Methylacidithermus pantelleriae]|uniref:Uncharacterized protein n=1 Tax=Candidatus Methylacidithermus pantelleriae TaxID=2744239 RepID=A0A8J2BKK2_9BACT|nr:hypothetical protein MPNT_370006 [Candidatus Methylacidithermus pantelleriae]
MTARQICRAIFFPFLPVWLASFLGKPLPKKLLPRPLAWRLILAFVMEVSPGSFGIDGAMKSRKKGKERF